MGEGVAGIGIDGSDGSLPGRHMVRVRCGDVLPLPIGRLNEHALGTNLSNQPTDVPAKVLRGVDVTVRVSQEVNISHPDDGRGCPLLPLPDPGNLRAGDGGVEATGIAVGHDAVGDRDTRSVPQGHGSGGAEVHIVWVGHHDEGALHLRILEHHGPF